MPDQNLSKQDLERIATEARIDIIQMIERAQSGHPGGSFSVIDLIVALFFTEMKWDPKNPAWEDRDRFILSKGHAVPALYVTLSRFGVISQEDLMTLRHINSKLQGHPDRVIMPVVEASTGSLGQGLSIAQGVAMALKLQKKAARVFCIIGDGESQEGQIWETAMSAPKFHLNNLVCFLDYNKGQLDGHTKDIMDIEPVVDKWRAFNWAVHEIDGHDFDQIRGALAKAREEKTKPTMIVANTVKGKGVSFMENNIGWHGSAPNKDELGKSLGELRGRLK